MTDGIDWQEIVKAQRIKIEQLEAKIIGLDRRNLKMMNGIYELMEKNQEDNEKIFGTGVLRGRHGRG
jgi:hypothetical protein